MKTTDNILRQIKNVKCHPTDASGRFLHSSTADRVDIDALMQTSETMPDFDQPLLQFINTVARVSYRRCRTIPRIMFSTSSGSS